MNTPMPLPARPRSAPTGHQPRVPSPTTATLPAHVPLPRRYYSPSRSIRQRTASVPATPGMLPSPVAEAIPSRPARGQAAAHPGTPHRTPRPPIPYRPDVLAHPRKQENAQPLPKLDVGRKGGIVVFTSPSGGVGTSTLVALTGLTLRRRGVTCALLDADLAAGGLGVLLGIEHESGLTMQTLDAPLGHLEGEALNHELPRWEDLPVLANTPWHGSAPQWWELQAAVTALGEANDVVLVDAGRGDTLAAVPELVCARQVMAVDLSVLGVARAKTHLARLVPLCGPAGTTDMQGTAGMRNAHTGTRRNGPDTQHTHHGRDADAGERPIVVGVEPRGASRRPATASVATMEAIAYLGEDVLGPVRRVPALCADMLGGLGIRAVPKRNRRVLEALADRIIGTGDDDERRGS